MEARTLLDFLGTAEKLKHRVRHSWSAEGRRESVAEHTYRLCVFAWLVKDEFPEYDMDRVIRMCIFHDIGEAVTGDVPSFDKTDKHRSVEKEAHLQIADQLPKDEREELLSLLKELEEAKTPEAKLVHALDKMEAVIQHNEAPIETWLDLEYDLQLTYGHELAQYHPYLKDLREVVRQDSLLKIEKEGKRNKKEGYYVSKSAEKIRVEGVKALLSKSYWAKNRSEEDIRESMAQSENYGVFNSENEMIGYARIVTDHTTMFYLMDVIIHEDYRGMGLGKMLMDEIMKDVGKLYGILHTQDCTDFYKNYGFVITSSQEPDRKEYTMEKIYSR